ncbi:hypothetical protein D9M68_161900 [compost metagenome]
MPATTCGAILVAGMARSYSTANPTRPGTSKTQSPKSQRKKPSPLAQGRPGNPRRGLTSLIYM